MSWTWPNEWIPTPQASGRGARSAWLLARRPGQNLGRGHGRHSRLTALNLAYKNRRTALIDNFPVSRKGRGGLATGPGITLELQGGMQ